MYAKPKKRSTSIRILLRTEDIANLLRYSLDHTQDLIYKKQIPFSKDHQQNLLILIEWMLKRNNKELFALLEVENLIS